MGQLCEAVFKAGMREVRLALLEADVNYKVAKDFCAQVSERAMGQEVMESLTPAQQVVKIVNEELTRLMGGDDPQTLHIRNKGQTVLMMCGLQGNGKTTHAAKLGKYYKAQGRRPLLVACDIYRPAAIDQLRIVGEQAGVPVFEMGTEKPERIAAKAIAYARDHGNDIVILDTAGRLQIDDDLMGELVRIKEAVEVDETLLVVDAMAGQEAVNVARTFNEKVGISGVILTKTDGDTRGGAALSVLAVTGKPINFQGTGEPGNPLGAKLIRCSAMKAGTAIGLDKGYALEMVTAGDVSVEYDRLIDRQLERAAITSISGFAKLYTEASKVLKV